MIKSLSANAEYVRDAGSITELGRSPGGGHGSPLQCSCLENLMDRGAWQAIVHGAAKSSIQLKRLSTAQHSKTYSQLLCPLGAGLKPRLFCWD